MRVVCKYCISHQEVVKIERWNILGFGDYLNDIIDTIHLNGGKIASLVITDPPDEKELMNLNRRLKFVDYDVLIIGIDDFNPLKGDKNCYGFIDGRNKIIDSFQSYNLDFPPLIHPDAYIGSNCTIGMGVVVGPKTVVAPNCKLGNFSLLNRGLSIGHDTELGEYVTLSPGVSIAGMVNVGSMTTVGIGATIIDELKIGNNSFVGAGAVVVNDVPDNVLVVGVPAKIVKKREAVVVGYESVPSKIMGKNTKIR
jgi:sugar O-acyltransferase (sialic acid O-acetyltransferase NeuD family)